MNETYHPRGLLVHGYRAREHPTYVIWADMKARCNNPKCSEYKNYGGRGIDYCDRWAHFRYFAEDVGLPPFPGATLDRIDNSKGYSPENCKWSTRTEQCHNRRLFKSNSSGAPGVLRLSNGSYEARYDHEHVRYSLGRFDTLEEAVSYRNKFIALLSENRALALRMLVRRARRDSSTGIRGITSHRGGFVVRKTVRGERVYLGHSTTLEGAVAILTGVSK